MSTRRVVGVHFKGGFLSRNLAVEAPALQAFAAAHL